MTLQEIKNIFFEEFAHEGYNPLTFEVQYPSSKWEVLYALKSDPLPNQQSTPWSVIIKISWEIEGRYMFMSKVLPIKNVSGGTRVKHEHKGTKPVYNSCGEKTTATTFGVSKWVEVTNISLKNIH